MVRSRQALLSTWVSAIEEDPLSTVAKAHAYVAKLFDLNPAELDVLFQSSEGRGEQRDSLDSWWKRALPLFMDDIRQVRDGGTSLGPMPAWETLKTHTLCYCRLSACNALRSVRATNVQVLTRQAASLYKYGRLLSGVSQDGSSSKGKERLPVSEYIRITRGVLRTEVGA